MFNERGSHPEPILTQQDGCKRKTQKEFLQGVSTESMCNDAFAHALRVITVCAASGAFKHQLHM
eukprot:6185241-Pleurochrysis_carterae.AAC.1